MRRRDITSKGASFAKRIDPAAFTRKRHDWWDDLPKAVQAEIDESIAEPDGGLEIPHEVVMQHFYDRYNIKA